jgi:hypothetical protein
MLDIVGYVRPLKTIKPKGSAKQSEGNASSPGNASSAKQPQPECSAKQSEGNASSPGNASSAKQPQPECSAKQSEGNASSPGNASSANQPEGPQPYKDAPSGKILEILRVRNRFDMKAGDPHWSGGFRDLAFKVKVGFKVLPVDAVSSSAS